MSSSSSQNLHFFYLLSNLLNILSLVAIELGHINQSHITGKKKGHISQSQIFILRGTFAFHKYLKFLSTQISVNFLYIVSFYLPKSHLTSYT
jgi:hypothetical protein